MNSVFFLFFAVCNLIIFAFMPNWLSMIGFIVCLYFSSYFLGKDEDEK